MSDIRDKFPTEEEPEEAADPFDEEQVADEKPKTKQKSVARSAGIVSIAVMFSRFFGLAREMVFSRLFGAGFLYDAFIVGFRIPNLLRDLFAEGALSAAFVKVFTDYQINKSEKEAWRLASLIFNGLAVILSLVTILGILLAPYYVPYIAWGFEPEKARLAVTLTQIMFPFILLVALAAVAMGVLNTKGHFGVPASASTAFNIVSIVFGLTIAYYLSGGAWDASNDKSAIPELPAQWAIIGMAIGTLIGGAAQFVIQIPSLYRVGFRFFPQISFSNPGVKRVMRLMGPAIIGTSAVQVKVLVDTFIVSGIEGGNSWLPYAFRLMQFPIGLFGVAIGTAAIPALSRLASENKTGEFRSTLSKCAQSRFPDDDSVGVRFDSFGRADHSSDLSGRRVHEFRYEYDGVGVGGVFGRSGRLRGDQGFIAVVLRARRCENADVCQPRFDSRSHRRELFADEIFLDRRRFARTPERFRSYRRCSGDFDHRADKFSGFDVFDAAQN